MPRIPDSSPQTIRLFEALLERPADWHYGYALSKTTGLASGTLYPILIRLVERSALETRWEPPAQEGRPARHLYRLTPDGLALATQRVASARRTRTTPRTAPRAVRALGTAT